MYPLKDRGVPPAEHQAAQQPDWESVRIFLEVVRHGSFRSAADSLKLSVNALRRRIDDLEQQAGTPLMTRHVDGIRTTAEGERMFLTAQQMEAASFDLLRGLGQAAPAISGEVRIGVTEGLGTFWLAPRLIEFQRAYPKLLVDLHCAMRSADVLRLEADAAVQLTKPTAPDLKVVKLGRLHSMPFASRDYIDTYGAPQSVEDIRTRHRIVLQIAEQTGTQQLYDENAPGQAQPGFVALRTNVSSSHVWAVAKGAGIGWVPTYVPAIGGPMVALDVDLRFQFDIWLTYHADVARIPRVRRLIDWIVESFDPRRYPWFRDEFIHPDELAKEYRGGPLINLFAGFAWPEQRREASR